MSSPRPTVAARTFFFSLSTAFFLEITGLAESDVIAHHGSIGWSSTWISSYSLLCSEFHVVIQWRCTDVILSNDRLGTSFLLFTVRISSLFCFPLGTSFSRFTLCLLGIMLFNSIKSSFHMFSVSLIYCHMSYFSASSYLSTFLSCLLFFEEVYFCLLSSFCWLLCSIVLTKLILDILQL